MSHKYEKPGGIAVGADPKEFHVLRVKTGTVTSDAAPFDVASYPQADDDTNVAVNCKGYETIFIRVAFTDSGSGTVKVTPRVLDAEDGLWFRIAKDDGTLFETADIGPSADRCYELRVANRSAVFFQVTIGGAVTDLTIYGIPGVRAVR